MKKILLSIFIVLCCLSQASAWMNVATVTGGGPPADSDPCASNYAAVTQSTGGSVWGNLYNGTIIGQSFTVPVSRKLYSITVTLSTGELGSAPAPSARVSSSVDLSSGYLAEETSIDMDTAGATEIIFTDQPDLSSGTTYYFGIYNAGASWAADRIGLDYSNSSVYANGVMYVSGASNGWDMTGQNADIRDLVFTIKLCGNAP